MAMPEFKNEHFDIVSILNSPSAVGPYRGHEVWTELEKVMNLVADGTLVLIDLKRTEWFNSAFCEPAFGPIFKALMTRTWSQKYLIFQMPEHHKRGFFQGVLKYLGKDVPRKEAENQFVAAGMYAKLMQDDGSINFVGDLSDDERTILDLVNNKRAVTAKQMVQESPLSAGEVVDLLRSLSEDKYFVAKFGAEHFYSFYKYFEKG